jgi:hypothetical protein
VDSRVVISLLAVFVSAMTAPPETFDKQLQC